MNKVINTFEETNETKLGAEMFPKFSCNKDHGLLGIGVLKVDTTKLFISTKPEGNNIV